MALGKQKDLFLPTLICCFLIAFPVGTELCFKTSLEGAGLIYGTFIGYVLFSVWLTYLLFFKYDWDKISLKIQKNTLKENKTSN